jgi:hypothetical protein
MFKTENRITSRKVSLVKCLFGKTTQVFKSCPVSGLSSDFYQFFTNFPVKVPFSE